MLQRKLKKLGVKTEIKLNYPDAPQSENVDIQEFLMQHLKK